MAQSGMALGWPSPIESFLTSERASLLHMDVEHFSWVTSLMPLGAILGGVLSGKAADRIGRKPMIIGAAVPFFISWIMLMVANSITILYVARFIGGIGVGAACVLVPVYIGEIAEPSIRGALGTFFAVYFSLGIVFSYITGAYLGYPIFNLCCCLTLVPFLASAVFLPETPAWLIQRGRKAEACRVLKIIRGAEYDVSEEISALLEDAEQVQFKKGGLRDLIGTKAGRKAIVTCVGLMWFQQMVGIDAVLAYTEKIFSDAGSTIDTHIATIIIGIIEVVMGVVVAVTIDR